MTDQSHIDEESIAALADGNQRALSPSAWKHVLGCATCQGTLLETVRISHAWEEGEARSPIDPHLRALAEKVSNSTGATVPRFAGLSRRRPTGGARWLRPISLAAGTALLATVVLLVLRFPTERGRNETNERIEYAILAASSRGLVLPGGELAREQSGGVYRSDGTPEAALLRDLEDLGRRLETESGSMDDYRTLISGEIAVGHFQAAQDHLDRATSAFGDEPVLLVLRALLAYRNNDLDTAELQFRNAIHLDPTNAVTRFNLAWILCEAGREDEAATEIVAVHALAPHSVLARRAEQLRQPR